MWRWCHFTSTLFLPQTCTYRLIMREPSIKGHSTKYLSRASQIYQGLQIHRSLRNHHFQEEPKETWSINGAWCQQWPQDWKKLIFIPIPKKVNAKESSKYCTIAFISHASKVMLKILQTRLQQYVNRELPDAQARFRKGRRTRDQNANICWIIEKAREFQKASTSSLTTLKPLCKVKCTTNRMAGLPSALPSEKSHHCRVSQSDSYSWH